MKQPEVSLIVLCWNKLNDTTKLFVELIKKTEGVDYEIVFWDNGSTDGTLEYLKSVENHWATHTGKRVIVKGVSKNIGFGAGNNEAVKYATGKYILFINNDILFHDPLWLRQLIDYAKQHPKTVPGAQLIDFNSATEFRHTMLPYLGGWCMLIEHEWIKKHGAFHPDFGWAYFEDCELSRRLIHTGYTLKEVNLGIEHLGSISSTGQLNIPEQFRYNKSVYRNLLYDYEKGKNKRIVFMATGMYPFNDETLEGKGVGGAEASLIQVTRQLAKLGYVVDVYNDTEVEGVFNGVNWNHINSFDYNDYADYFVLFRNSMKQLDNVSAGVKIFWSCDQHTTNDWAREILPFIDCTFAISKYHKEYLQNKTALGQKPIEVIDLGIDPADYPVTPKVPGKMIFCSVPRRGLKYLIEYFPKIKARDKRAELYITSDYTLWGAGPENQEFREAFDGMEGVHFLGKIPRSELIKHQLESVVMAYPCDYDENFCISALECMAAGAIPVTTAIGALPTTVADRGVVIKDFPGGVVFQEKFINSIVEILGGKVDNFNPRYVLDMYSWERLVKEQWHVKLEAMSVTRRNNYCKDCEQNFENGYEYYKHRAEKHLVTAVIYKNGNFKTSQTNYDVIIRTTRPVELSFNENLNFVGVKELIVPQESSGDIIRILTDAYGADIIERSEVQKSA